ncbi:MAG: helicase-related protein, partial [Rhizomicrobium sp.]
MNPRRAARGTLRPSEGGRIAAVLGPTNTGKTHFAIERMLAHRSGMIGLPLRLLAREVYDKVARIKGAKLAALITGEEKIVPPEARYFVCTVEAMPLDLGVAFLAIDEIQLCADPERGHVFTDRLLHARGEEETLFLGAETMRGTIQRFVPEAHFITRPRFSDLAYTGAKKLTRLPRRSAIVAFSAEDVYGIADLVRRQRGGAAVVLGALSPRTRNAQVALYQSGEVDFLVATDAIGMGINMDVDHVAFAELMKFDGVGVRPLRPDELGQIAGRAGRHMNDGTFGVTAEAEALDEETVARIEGHRYEPVRILQWRNSALSFRSLGALIESLEEPPPQRGLAKARPAMDFASLRILAGQDEYRALASTPASVKRLWEACQLPDFRKLTPDEHVRLVGQIYRHLMSDAGVLPEDWLARQVSRLDEIDGDVATLSGRLAQIRTWTYAAHRPGWVADAAHWQEQTRAVEDRLSDALHERLTQRFI